MLARGPGSLGVSPYDSPEPALYVIVYEMGRLFMELHPEGASVRRSQIPVKPSQFATVKNCNYLSNVMMKREAVDWGVDFTVGFDEAGMMAEGATENFGVVTRRGELLFPRIGAVLAGTTMLRVMQLAEVLVSEGRLARAAFADVSEREVREADELLIVGTTHNVASARSFEGAALGVRAPGPVGQALNALLERDIAENEALRTRY
jgi:branched-chain amino acid aminotransferase